MIHQDIAVPNPQGWHNVADAIFHNARRRPAHAAIVEPAHTITYAELAVLVAKTAGHLETIGVAPGDIVGVALGDDADHVVRTATAKWPASSRVVPNSIMCRRSIDPPIHRRDLSHDSACEARRRATSARPARALMTFCNTPEESRIGRLR
jgi:non-ribosomal peptide synthetase component F